MARKAALDSCMFCADEPCAMHAPKEKVAPKPRKKAVKAAPVVAAPAPVAAPVPDDPPMPAAPRKAAVRAAMRAHVKPSTVTTMGSAASDHIMDDAIRALVPILHPDETHKHRVMLSQPRTVEVRAAAWRERRRGIT